MATTRAQLVDAATDLNKVLDLSPAIDVKQGVEKLKDQIKEAAILLSDDDAVEDATREVIKAQIKVIFHIGHLAMLFSPQPIDQSGLLGC